jgi:putative GTP pyrophosphokinase
MASLDFELEKAAFRDFYDQNAVLLEAAQKSFIALTNALVTHSGKVEVSKIEGRIKDREECIRKFSRKYQTVLEERDEPYEIRSHVTDLIGLRIVCLYEDAVEGVADILRSHFEVISITDKVSAVESTEGSFGYKGLHMDLRLNAARSVLPEYQQYAQFRFELQVRSIIQDSWSVLDHKIKYKKSIPNQLKRRINVLAALFELADREFRAIRDSTESELRGAPDETVAQTEPIAPSPGAKPAPGGELNAFTFLKIASHFFRDFDFEPKKVDGFVGYIREWAPDITRAQFNTLMRDNIGLVRLYKEHFEAQTTNKLNPFTVIRHCLYLGDRDKFSKALSRLARETFQAWLYDPKVGWIHRGDGVGRRIAARLVCRPWQGGEVLKRADWLFLT